MSVELPPLAPDARAALDAIRRSGRPPFETMPHLEARALYHAGRHAMQPEPEPVGDVRDVELEGGSGTLRARLYRGQGLEARPAAPVLVFFHGGGWVVGDLETHDGLCRWLANSARAAVLSVEYRLAPEHRYPAAVEDAVAATKSAIARSRELGLDPRRVAVGGDSAGANLAAAVALQVRDEDGPHLRHQLLIYPSVDLSGRKAPWDEIAGDFPLTSKTMAWFRDHYIHDPEHAAQWQASPLCAADHSGLPPAYVVTVGYDPLRSEGQAYVRALQQAGVPVVHRHLPDLMHGFMTMGRFVRAAEVEAKAAGSALRATFGQGRPTAADQAIEPPSTE